jgi:hypothetical protein
MLVMFFSIVILMGLFASRLARQKGRDSSLWFCLGMCFGLMAIIVLYFLEDVRPAEVAKPVVHEEVPGVWYTLDHKHEPIGPFSFGDIRSQLSEGVLKSDSYLWKEDWAEWKLASEVVELK